PCDGAVALFSSLLATEAALPFGRLREGSFAVFGGCEPGMPALRFATLEIWDEGCADFGSPLVFTRAFAEYCFPSVPSCLPLFAGRRGVTPRTMCSPQFCHLNIVRSAAPRSA